MPSEGGVDGAGMPPMGGPLLWGRRGAVAWGVGPRAPQVMLAGVTGRRDCTLSCLRWCMTVGMKAWEPGDP